MIISFYNEYNKLNRTNHFKCISCWKSISQWNKETKKYEKKKPIYMRMTVFFSKYNTDKLPDSLIQWWIKKQENNMEKGE